MDEHNHALAALRYLVSQLDAGKGLRARVVETEEEKEWKREERERRLQREWLSVRNEELWRRIG